MTQQEAKENRKQQREEIMQKVDELLELIMNSEDYLRYQKKLVELQENEEIYRRVNEFRRRHMELQMDGENEESFNAIQDLYSQYRDILMEPIVSRFMIREQSICKLLRKVHNRIADGIDIDISYLQ